MNKNDTNLPNGVILLDSLGDLKPDNSSPILVCGSHCGGNGDLARHVKNCHVKAVFLNNAGVGKKQAGIRELANYDAEGVLACAVDNFSAEIGISQDTYDNGIISHLNPRAEFVGIQVGDSVQQAVAKITAHKSPFQQTKTSESADQKESKTKGGLKKQKQAEVGGIKVTIADSITFLNENNADDIVVCGSHGGMSAGKYAKKHQVKAVFFNDAGIGRNNAGIKSLEYLNSAGILACTVDCMTAEIFNGQDVLENGIITVCNQLAEAKGITKGMIVKEAISLIAD